MIDFKVIILFLIFTIITCIIGCNTFFPSSNTTWLMPKKPVSQPVQFIRYSDGLYIDKISSINLMINIEEEDAYIAKIEALVKEMKSYYGAK